MAVKPIRRKRRGECVYCGRKGYITNDHIPPKNLFAKPRPPDLITVPCCSRCNKAAQKDDEYFRLTLALREGADNAAAKKARQKVLRSLAKPEQRGFSTAFLKTIKQVNLFTPSGLFVGRRSGYDVDWARLYAVVDRVTKGLFYKERGYRLPDTWEVSPFAAEGQERSEEVQRVVSTLLRQKSKAIGPGVFEYWVAFAEDKANASAWILRFYEAVDFFALTLPTEVVNRDSK